MASLTKYGLHQSTWLHSEKASLLVLVASSFPAGKKKKIDRYIDT